MRRIAIQSIFVGVALLAPAIATAQSSSNSSISALSRANAGTNITNRINNNPTVSPYLRLLQGNGNAQAGFGGANAVYQTQVRPAIERRQQAAQQQAQIQGIQRNLGQLRQQFARPTQGFMQTGHATRFMSYSHYYPTLFGR